MHRVEPDRGKCLLFKNFQVEFASLNSVKIRVKYLGTEYTSLKSIYVGRFPCDFHRKFYVSMLLSGREIYFLCVKFFSLCNLYNWRYKKLGNLQHVHSWPEYCTANPGFFYDFQLINVEDFNGVGESQPNPYFYQVR